MSHAQYPFRSIACCLLAVVFSLPIAAVVQAQSLVPLQDVVQVAASSSHTCVLTTGGGVKCWGWNYFGQLGDGSTTNRLFPVDVISLGSGVQAISVGDSRSCALTAGGAVKCWGAGQSTPVDIAGLDGGVQAISAGSAHFCALTSTGGMKCWGSNNYGQLGEGSSMYRDTPVDVIGLSSGVQAISAGAVHTCAVTTGGAAKCWGYNVYGQLGDGSTVQQFAPVDVVGLGGGMQAISAGGEHTCALASGGAVKCWGRNVTGALGDGSNTNRLTPVDVVGLADAVTVDTGYAHTCALSVGGAMTCWGANGAGQGGDGSFSSSMTPVAVHGLSANVTAIALGNNHSCAVTSGNTVKCWGWNNEGQLGDGRTSRRLVAVDVPDLAGNVVAINAGYTHSCAMTQVGGVRCWGFNDKGQLGDGTTAMRNTPVGVAGLASGVVAVAAGIGTFGHTCAVTTNGGVKCWGANNVGQLGTGDTTDRLAPEDVVGLSSGISAVAVGGIHACALTVIGGVKCWGFNGYGQLGDGSSTTSASPVDVHGLPSGIVAIAAGYYHTCALTNTGAVLCWGWNSNGQLGDGSTAQRLMPVGVAGLGGGVVAISTGQHHTCALSTSGGAKCWGGNVYGQLGDGTSTSRLVPTDVQDLTAGVWAIDASNFHTCALTEAGGAKCWGSNNNGTLGNGTTTSSAMPVDVTGLENGIAAVDAGGEHACALTEANSMKCWGNHHFGALGIGGSNYALPGDVLVPVLSEHDASLSVLSLAPVLPGFAFSSETTQYQVPVDNAVQSLSFTPVTSNPAATIMLNGQPIGSGETSAALPLAVGTNTFILRVTAADGITQRDYHIAAIRLSSAPAQLQVSIASLEGVFGRGSAETRQYRINVLNVGSVTAQNVSLTVPAPAGLTDAAWTCHGPHGCTPAANEGAVTTAFDLPPGESAHVDLIGQVLPGVAFVDITAHASTASGGGAQTQGSLSEGANGIGLMKNGFEQ